MTPSKVFRFLLLIKLINYTILPEQSLSSINKFVAKASSWALDVRIQQLLYFISIVLSPSLY